MGLPSSSNSSVTDMTSCRNGFSQKQQEQASSTPSELGSSISAASLSEVGTSYSSRDLVSFTYRRTWKDVAIRAAKGFGVGYGSPVVLGVVKWLARFIRKGGKGMGKGDIWNILSDLGNIRLGAFVSTMVGLYLSARLKLQDKQTRFKPALAGLLGGLALSLAPASSRANIALFVGVRSAEVVAKYAAQEGYVPTISHGDTLLSMLVRTYFACICNLPCLHL
jgi:hypothetical protein